MIVIKIELWPNGDHTEARTIGVGAIVNDGSGDHFCGNYNFYLGNGDGGRRWKKKIKGFPRSLKGVWELLGEALREYKGE